MAAGQGNLAPLLTKQAVEGLPRAWDWIDS